MPDLFTAGGMSAISIVEALKKTKGDTDVDTLIKKMEGMEFDTPKGKMKFREGPPSDADAVFYHIEKARWC